MAQLSVSLPEGQGFEQSLKEQNMLANQITDLINATTLHSPQRTPSPDLDKSAFLELLVKQMANQDPLDPMSNDDFVSQLAQFGSLEQQINLNNSFNQFLTFQKLTQASTLLGKKVICLVPSEEGSLTPTSGVVEQVMLVDNTAYLKLSNGDEVPLDSVVSVESAGGDS
jgi:flagellar basal-body rod modification protein FlgD